jgi:hypothetical protein
LKIRLNIFAQGACFVGEKQVLVAQEFGEYGVSVQYVTKNIEDVQVGDVVLAKNQHDPNGPLVECTVVDTFIRYDKEVATVTLINSVTNETLEITGTLEHPFYVTEKGFVALGDLEIGDVCVAPDGNEFVVTEIVVHEERQTVYNFEVEGAHTYYVGTGFDTAVLVHNQSENIPPPTFADQATIKERNRTKDIANGQIRKM